MTNAKRLVTIKQLKEAHLQSGVPLSTLRRRIYVNGLTLEQAANEKPANTRGLKGTFIEKKYTRSDFDKAARMSGVSIRTLRNRMRELNITLHEAAHMKLKHGGARNCKPKESEKKNVGNSYQKDVNYEARNKLFNVNVANRYHGLRLV